MTEQIVDRGVFAPVLTPFKADLAPDPARFVAFCHRLMKEGCNGLVLFGTTSEANSLSADERMALTEAAVEDGIAPGTLIVGAGLCAIPDTIRLTRHAVGLGCAGVLMLPPFYYKGMSDEGLFRAYAEVIERVGDARLKVYLYHIPQVSNVPLGLDLVGRLIEAFPGTVVGIKDSSGDRGNTHALITRFPGFRVFPGSEALMLAALREGAAGCITATANINAGAIRALFDTWDDAAADDLQARLTAVREALQTAPLVPGLKCVVARALDDPDWDRVRPPFVKLDDAAADRLIKKLAAAGLDL